MRDRRWPFLHPGRSAAVLAGEQTLGFLGELHPLVARAWDLERTASFASTSARSRRVPRAGRFRAFPAVPALRRDLAVTLPEDIAAARSGAVRAAAGEVLKDVNVFDVYSGEQVGEGRRSLALALSFRSPERTLTDEDIAPARQRILGALEALGGELRG